MIVMKNTTLSQNSSRKMAVQPRLKNIRAAATIPGSTYGIIFDLVGLISLMLSSCCCHVCSFTIVTVGKFVEKIGNFWVILLTNYGDFPSQNQPFTYDLHYNFKVNDFNLECSYQVYTFKTFSLHFFGLSLAHYAIALDQETIYNAQIVLCFSLVED